jgi:hypothetical protein
MITRRLYLVMNSIAYELEYSVEAEVSLSFAWNWRTDIQNWDDAPAPISARWPIRQWFMGNSPRSWTRAVALADS